MTPDTETRPPLSARDLLTVPNTITVIRIIGSLVLPFIAAAGHEWWFIGLFGAFVMTDWLDGKLAVLLDQCTTLGASLDSIADVVLYAALIAGTALLKPQFIRNEAILIGTMLASYLIVVIIALARFRRLPAYHTRIAKTCWLFVAIGAIMLVVGGTEWPARVAMMAVIVGNAEATAISFVLRRWTPNVPSLWHAVRQARE